MVFCILVYGTLGTTIKVRQELWNLSSRPVQFAADCAENVRIAGIMGHDQVDAALYERIYEGTHIKEVCNNRLIH